MNKWLELAAKCEAATEPDREIDKALLAAATDFRQIDDNLYEMQNWYYTEDGDETHPALPSPMASLDVITALIEREFPGKVVGSNTTSWGRAVASVENTTMGGKTEALARCAVFCMIMAAKSPEETPETASADCK